MRATSRRRTATASPTCTTTGTRAPTTTAAAVAFLDDLATAAAAGAPARVLELAVGTGRLAVPLVGRATDVTGLDASAAMLGRLAAADPHGAVTTVIGRHGRRRCLSVGPVRSRPRRLQLAVHAHRARRPAGVLRRGRRRASRRAERSSSRRSCPGPAAVRVGRHACDRCASADVVLAVSSATRPPSRSTASTSISPTASRCGCGPWRIRYATPAQLDAMAAAVGMRPAERYEDVARRPFRPASDRHVTVYRRRRDRR